MKSDQLPEDVAEIKFDLEPGKKWNREEVDLAIKAQQAHLENKGRQPLETHALVLHLSKDKTVQEKKGPYELIEWLETLKSDIQANVIGLEKRFQIALEFLYDDGSDHWLGIDFKLKGNNLSIFISDSITSNDKFVDILLRVLINSFKDVPNLNVNIRSYVDNTQYDHESCSRFALSSLFWLQKTRDFHERLSNEVKVKEKSSFELYSDKWNELKKNNDPRFESLMEYIENLFNKNSSEEEVLKQFTKDKSDELKSLGTYIPDNIRCYSAEVAPLLAPLLVGTQSSTKYKDFPDDIKKATVGNKVLEEKSDKNYITNKESKYIKRMKSFINSQEDKKNKEQSNLLPQTVENFPKNEISHSSINRFFNNEISHFKVNSFLNSIKFSLKNGKTFIDDLIEKQEHLNLKINKKEKEAIYTHVAKEMMELKSEDLIKKYQNYGDFIQEMQKKIKDIITTFREPLKNQPTLPSKK